MTQPLERGVPHSPEIKLVSQMTGQDFQKLAEISGGIVDPDVTIDGRLARLMFPLLHTAVQFARANPTSNRVDSVIFTDWGSNGSVAFLRHCAAVSNNESTSFVAQRLEGSIVEIITLTKGGVIRYRIYPEFKDMEKLDSNIQKAVSLVLAQPSSRT